MGIQYLTNNYRILSDLWSDGNVDLLIQKSVGKFYSGEEGGSVYFENIM
jgi:hypothetical protein